LGFISGRSTVLQLLQVLDKWKENLDKGGCVNTIYWAFMKEFDKVPNFRLIHKLEKYQITRQCSRWTRRAWKYQNGNQNLYIKEEQTTHWPKEKVQKDKQRSTKHTHKIKDRVTRTPLKTAGELMCSGRGGSSCSTSGI